MADLRLGPGASFAVCAPYLTIRCVVGAEVCCYDNLWSVQQLLSFHALDGRRYGLGTSLYFPEQASSLLRIQR